LEIGDVIESVEVK